APAPVTIRHCTNNATQTGNASLQTSRDKFVTRRRKFVTDGINAACESCLGGVERFQPSTPGVLDVLPERISEAVSFECRFRPAFETVPMIEPAHVAPGFDSLERAPESGMRAPLDECLQVRQRQAIDQPIAGWRALRVWKICIRPAICGAKFRVSFTPKKRN